MQDSVVNDFFISFKVKSRIYDSKVLDTDQDLDTDLVLTDLKRVCSGLGLQTTKIL